jgi:hypothetical protein
MCLSGFGQNRFVSFGNRVFQVSPTNQISTLRLPLKRSWQSEARGSTLPHVAPDSSYIAFIRDYDLWLYDTRKQSSVHVTHRGRPYSKTLASVETLISAWAVTSQKLLIAVVPGDTECVDCEDRGDWTVRQSAYGYFIYDLNAGTLRKANLPNDFVVASLLADGRIIGATSVGGNPPISIISPAGTMKVAPGSFKVSQLDVWNDGSRAVAAVFTPNASYILKLDLMAGESVQLSTTGTEAQYQWPRLSPDGKHTAWIRGREDLLIDGKSLFSCSASSLQFEWLDEQKIAIDCSKQIFVIDGASGKQLAQADTQE